MLNRNLGTPLYLQVKQRLLDEIQAGKYDVGDMLPPERILERRFGVSRITVRRAVGDLATSGYVSRIPGSGTRVLARRIRHRDGKLGGFHEDLAEQGFVVRADLLVFEQVPAPPDVAERMSIPSGSSLTFLRKLIRASGTAIALHTSYHDFDPSVELSEDEARSGSIFATLRRDDRVAYSRAERLLEAALPTREEARLLEIDVAQPVLKTELSAFDADQRLVSYVRAVYRGDKYVYHQELALT